MPSKSKKQRRFMAAAANNPKFAKKAGIKSSVAKEFHDADRKAGYARGGLASAVRPMLESRLVGRAPPPRVTGGGALSRAAVLPGSGPKTSPGVISSRMPPDRGPGPYRGGYPPKGALGQAGAGLGGVRRPQPSGMPPTGRMSGVPGRMQNGLLRTADAALNRTGDRLGRMGVPMRRFAGGGKVKNALKALEDARGWLTETSDEPEFTTALALLKDVPESQELQTQVRKAKARWDDSKTTPEEITKIFLDLEDKFKRHRASLSDAPQD